jgi:hypothetical protein
MRACAFCGHTLDEYMEVFRSSTCPACGKDLKVCLNCKYYRPGAHWDCLETIADPVAEKDRSNFCDYFHFRRSSETKPGPKVEEAARDTFKKLFGEPG